jgi:hypothetical protein
MIFSSSSAENSTTPGIMTHRIVLLSCLALLERETGIEPATSSLGSWHSTAELLPLNHEDKCSFADRIMQANLELNP